MLIKDANQSILFAKIGALPSLCDRKVSEEYITLSWLTQLLFDC